MHDGLPQNSSKQERYDYKRPTVAFVIFLLLAILAWYGFYPGTMSPDSYEQYAQAKTFQFDEHHPPAMALLWSLLLPLKGGPQPLLFLQLLLYFTCWFLLFTKLEQEGTHKLALATGICAVAPFCINFAGVIWKDVHNALPWFFVSIIAIFFPQKARRYSLLLLILLWYGWMVRGNAVLAVLPLIFLITYKKERKLIANATIVVAIFGLFFVGKAITHEAILKPSYSDPYSRAMVHDLAGIKYFGGNPALPSSLMLDNPNLERQLSHYQPDDIKSILFTNPDGNIILRKSNPAAMDDLKSGWLKSVTENPVAYIKHRFFFGINFMHIGRERGYYLREVHFPQPARQAGVETAYPVPSTTMHRWILLWEKWPFMYGWFWIIGLFILLLFGIKSRAMSEGCVLLALSGSGFLYLAPHFIFGQAPDFRYYYWAIFAVILGAIVIIQKQLWKQENIK
ncbi:hypothetical protein [Parasphingorhabdus litoris]|uniref:hypothetical protein n=1 Tax=Parasphingorhabdus litoris TaxID=394733 RepID=UPI001E3B1E74|nr:hypothetical protein [Parasphingorhabdus litoris]